MIQFKGMNGREKREKGCIDLILFGWNDRGKKIEREGGVDLIVQYKEFQMEDIQKDERSCVF